MNVWTAESFPHPFHVFTLPPHLFSVYTHKQKKSHVFITIIYCNVTDVVPSVDESVMNSCRPS